MENMDKEDLTVDDIASRMCMSRITFYNKWKLLMGEAPKYLISRIRMEKARELLESGKEKLYRFTIPEGVFWKNTEGVYEKSMIFI